MEKSARFKSACENSTERTLQEIRDLYCLYKQTLGDPTMTTQDLSLFWSSSLSSDGNAASGIPKEWQRANEALQEVQQTHPTKSGSSSTNTVSSSSSTNQQHSVVNYPYQCWPQMYAYAGYQGYMPNFNYCQMAFRNGYPSYSYDYGMPAMPTTSPQNSVVTAQQNQSVEDSSLNSVSSPQLPAESSPTTTAAATVKLLASQPPPPPPTPPPPPPSAPAPEIEERNMFTPRNKQAPGAGGIRFTMPKRRAQKGNTLLDFKNNNKKKNKNKKGGGAPQNNPNFFRFNTSPEMEQSEVKTPDRDSPYMFDVDLNRTDWPPALRDYISMAFNKCKSQHDKDQVEKILKDKLVRAFQNGTLWKKDWTSEPLPLSHGSEPKKEETPSENRPDIQSRLTLPKHILLKQKNAYHKTPARRRQWSPTSRSRSRSRSKSRSRSRSPSSRKVLRRKRYSSCSSNDSSGSNGGSHSAKKQSISSSIVGPSDSRNNNSNRLWNTPRYSGKKKNNKNKKKMGKMQFSVEEEFSTDDRLQKRAARFETSGGKKGSSLILTINNSPAAMYEDAGDIDWSSYAIIGTCQDIEKPFLRLTGAVDPKTIRPEEVLEKSLQMVKDHWVQHQDYHFACEQLKSIRQDLTVQCVRNAFTIQAYETHARIALEKGDHTEFNQCQSQLKMLYEELHEGNRQEFLGYRILYNIYTNDTREIKNILATLTPEDKQDEVIAHALKCNLAWTLSNFHVFFKLYVAAPKMSGFILDWFVLRVRKAALKAYLKSFRPSIPVTYVQSEFRFSSVEEALAFLEEVRCVLSADRSHILCKESQSVAAL